MQQYKSEAEWDITRWERNYSQLSEQHKYGLVSVDYTARIALCQPELSISVFVCAMSNLWHVIKPCMCTSTRHDICSCIHRALLPHQPAKFAAARNCIHNNYLFIKSLLAVHQDSQDSPAHLSSANSAAAEHAKRHRQVAPGDMEKVRSATQKCFWHERHAKYGVGRGGLPSKVREVKCMLQWTLTRRLCEHVHVLLTAQTDAHTDRRESCIQTYRAVCITYTPFVPTWTANKLEPVPTGHT